MAKKITESQLRSAVKSLRRYLGEAPEGPAVRMPPDDTKFKFVWTNLNPDLSSLDDDGTVLTVKNGEWAAELPNGTITILSNDAYIEELNGMFMQNELQVEMPEPNPQAPGTGANDSDAGESQAQAIARGDSAGSPTLDAADGPSTGGPGMPNDGTRAQVASDGATSMNGQNTPDINGENGTGGGVRQNTTGTAAQRPPASQGSAQWAPGVLGLGSRGPEVSALQTKLGIKPPTGVFDQATKQAVMALQKKLPGVDVDGAYGPQTKAAEGKAAPAATPAKPVAAPVAAPATDFKGAANELNSDEGNRQAAADWQETPESYTSYREDATLARIIHLAGR